MRSPYILPPGLPGALPANPPGNKLSAVLDHLGEPKVCETVCTTLVAAVMAFLITLFLSASISRLYCTALEATRATLIKKRPPYIHYIIENRVWLYWSECLPGTRTVALLWEVTPGLFRQLTLQGTVDTSVK
jgi:hypothetical protein